MRIRPGRHVNWDVLADRTRSALICSWRGHDWRPKMTGKLCRRCSAWTL